MKVTRDTPDQLILSHVPWLWGLMIATFTMTFVSVGLALLSGGEIMGLLFAVLGGGLGLAAFAAFVRRVQVILDRAQGHLVIRSRTVFGYTEVIHALSDLDGAVLEETIGSKGGTLYRPTLVLGRGMSAGRHPIVPSYTNTGGPRRMVQAVNAWLAQAGPGAQDGAQR